MELDKVLQMLKNETSCDDAAELALEVKPSTVQNAQSNGGRRVLA